MAFNNAYAGKSVLVTGHTGFKGAWLAEWLLALGAKVTGLALAPPTTPSLFAQLGLARRLTHVEGDIRNLEVVRNLVEATQPHFVFHLAAQPLVRLSYEQPVETYATNIMGTVHVLEAVRQLGRSCAVVCVTTDKCYENKEWVHSYREEDPMGGYDPYSSSKGAAEIVINAYRRSYFSQSGSLVQLASARAGNVVGGGDWAVDRIIPDCIRSLVRGEAIAVRNRFATRPWQHVLEPLSGYLWLAARLALTANSNHPGDLTLRSGFNFGPPLTSNRSVAELVEEVLRHWKGSWEDRSDPNAVHEAKFLNLATDKAFHFLNWQSVWNFSDTLAQTIQWYRSQTNRTLTDETGVAAFTRDQIASYQNAALKLALPWAS